MTEFNFSLFSLFKRLYARFKYKDVLFRRVFREKEDLLDLYNAINGTSYADPNLLEINTLEDALFMSMKNDKSFIIASTINLYEHQSTNNPNMPIRGLLYFARLYEGYIAKNRLDIYGTKKIMLPTPHFIVFYNGSDEMPDEKIIKLSDSFIRGKNDKIFPELECYVRILNINYGHNEETLNACKRLSDYSQFIHIVGENLKSGVTNEIAVSAAIDYCIEHDILSDILLKARSEVMHSLLTYYDEKLHLKTVWNEGYEAGQKEIDELKKTYDKLKKTNDELKKTNDELKKTNGELKSSLQDKIAEIAKKDAEIAKLDDEIAKVDAEIAKVDAEIEELNRQLAEKQENND